MALGTLFKKTEDIEKAKEAFKRLKAGKVAEAEKMYGEILAINKKSFYGNLGMADVERTKDGGSLTVSYIEKAAKSSYSPAEGEKSFIKQMLNDIVTPPEEDGGGKYSLLETATCFDNYTAVRFLLENGADPNYTTPDGYKALFWAACRDQNGNMHPNGLMIGELLVDYGATYNVTDFVAKYRIAPSQEFIAMLQAGPNPSRKRRKPVSVSGKKFRLVRWDWSAAVHCILVTLFVCAFIYVAVLLSNHS